MRQDNCFTRHESARAQGETRNANVMQSTYYLNVKIHLSRLNFVATESRSIIVAT